MHFEQKYIASHSSHVHDEGGSRNNSSSIRQKEKRGSEPFFAWSAILTPSPFQSHSPCENSRKGKKDRRPNCLFFYSSLSLSLSALRKPAITLWHRYRMNHKNLIRVREYVFSGMTFKHNCFSCFFHSGNECSVHFLAAHTIFCYTFPCFSAFSPL